jgi:hypothetical protein
MPAEMSRGRGPAPGEGSTSLLLEWHGIAEPFQVLVHLLGFDVNFLVDHWEEVLDMSKEHLHIIS